MKQTDFVIKRSGKVTTRVPKESINTRPINLVDNDISRINFQHFKGITDTIDIIQQIDQYTTIREMDMNFFRRL